MSTPLVRNMDSTVVFDIASWLATARVLSPDLYKSTT